MNTEESEKGEPAPTSGEKREIGEIFGEDE